MKRNVSARRKKRGNGMRTKKDSVLKMRRWPRLSFQRGPHSR